jgi:menaquinone-dependent protoporphyrinogen oxidase
MTTTFPPSSRRKFLSRSCLTAAAVGLTICGGGTAAALYQPKIDPITAAYGEKTVDNRILIAYATRAGSTAEIAAKIGEILSRQSLSADVLPVAKVSDLSPYRAVILGSAVRMGRVLPNALKFVQTNQAALQQKSFSTFVVCMTLKDDTAANRQEAGAYLDPIRALVKPASEGLFAGVLNPAKLALIDRLIMSAMKSPQGDFRNWDQINTWAQSLPASLN